MTSLGGLSTFTFLFQHERNQWHNFSLSTRYPKHVFTQDDMNTTLLDLQLAPSAIIIVLPVSQSPIINCLFNMYFVFNIMLYTGIPSLLFNFSPQKRTLFLLALTTEVVCSLCSGSCLLHSYPCGL